jgi:prepilin-type processing-associated H-X9-DG protein
MMSEQGSPVSQDDIHGLAADNVTPSGGVGPLTNMSSNPLLCLAVVKNGRYDTTKVTVHWERPMTTNWASSLTQFNGFCTVLPPNSGSFLAASVAGGTGANSDQRALISPSSYHPGGVNALMADGSVRFIPNSINTGDLTKPQVSSGPSPYGVWGALGSIDGGEVVSDN